MDKYEKRTQRIREIFVDEANDVCACKIVKEGERLIEDCEDCESFPFCKKVFEEEAEGGG